VFRGWEVIMAIRSGAVRLVMVAALAAAGCGVYDGNGERATQTRPLQGFTAVAADGSLDVEIQRGDAFDVTVSIDSNLLNHVRTDLTDGGATLSIDLDGHVWDILPGPHVIVTMPVLQRGALNGSGSMTASGFAQADPVTLELDGSGLLTYDGQVPSAQVRSWGSGDMRLHGTTGSLDARLDGSGDVDARDFPSATAVLALSGSGNLSANVSTSAQVTLSGSGNVNLYGGAAIQHASISGSGSLTQH
jgi:uncharacterized protein YdeI (BOF family)